MSIVLPQHSYNTTVTPGSIRIGIYRHCHYCGAEVGNSRPVVIFGLQRPEVVGAAHTECGYFDLRYAQFGISAALTLSRSETSLLAHFYYKLFRLPGQGQPQAALRRCLAALLLDYPGGLASLPVLIAQFKAESRAELELYAGDLETDFYMFLGQVRKTAMAEPLGVEIDFT
jgi:hypothetical protein